MAWTIYNAEKQYMATCKELGAAARVVSYYGPGATITNEQGRIVWTEGHNGIAAEDYDAMSEVVHDVLYPPVGGRNE